MGWYKSFVFSNPEYVLLPANISILTATNTNGTLIMGGKALRETSMEKCTYKKAKEPQMPISTRCKDDLS